MSIGGKVILVVDDSIVYRGQIKQVVSEVDGVAEVVTAGNGLAALDKLRARTFDLVVLDIEMPALDGLGTLREMKRLGISVPVIMFSGTSRSSTEVTFEALQEGANEFVAKPTAEPGGNPVQLLRNELIPKIKQFAGLDMPSPQIERRPAPAAHSKNLRPKSTLVHRKPQIIAIASSTGGPTALEDLFEGLGSPRMPPVVIAQHMPPVFTVTLAERLDKLSNLTFREAKDGDVVQPGFAYIAPGDFHLEIEVSEGEHVLRTNQNPRRQNVRPCADFLFESVAAVYESKCAGIVLTGMGYDGRDGALAMRESGGAVAIQDKETSVVWGMPGGVYEVDAYDECLSLDSIKSILKHWS